MTWLDIKTASLQKMYAISGNDVTEDDVTRDYLAAMPYAANEGLQRLATVGKYLILTGTITQDGTQSGVVRHDLSELTDFYSVSEIYFENDEGYGKASNCTVEAGRYLTCDGTIKGTWTVYYNSYPQIITSSTPDETVMNLDPEMGVLLPLYIVSQLYKDDDISISTVYRNEFEAGLDDLKKRKPAVERFESGWI